MRNESQLDRLSQRIKEGNELVREARTGAVESIIALDSMLTWIIVCYFTLDKSKEGMLYEMLTLLTTSQKIEAFSNLETTRGIKFSKRYKIIVQRLQLVNSYRNTMVHGFPSVLYDTKVWRGRGKLLPFPLTRKLVQRMDEVGESTLDSLTKVFDLVLKKRNVRQGPKRTRTVL